MGEAPGSQSSCTILIYASFFQLESFLSPPLEGLVLQCYGPGNVPSDRRDLLEILEKAVARGIIIVSTTQCLQGAVSSSYQTGQVINRSVVAVCYNSKPV